MSRATSDLYVLYKRSSSSLTGMIVLQVDYSLGFGDDSFLSLESKTADTFKCKDRKLLTSVPTAFNGVTLQRNPADTAMITMTQSAKIKGLTYPKTQKEFASVRAACQYVGVNCRPEVCAPVRLVASGSLPMTTAEFKVLNKAIKHLQDTQEIGLNFVPIHLESERIVLVSDAYFSNGNNLRSQLGYVMLLADDSSRANIVHFASNRSNRVARSVMTSELHSLMLGFDIDFVIQHLLEEVPGQRVSIEAFKDSKNVFYLVAKDGRATEKRLLLDIAGLK